MLSPVIQISSLTRRFGETNAVNQLTLDVQTGEIFGFLGHNGAGKTTTVRLLHGVLEPTSGETKVLGLDPQAQGPALRARTGSSLKRRRSMNVSQLGTIYPFMLIYIMPHARTFSRV